MLKLAVLSGWHVHADEYAKEFSQIPGVELTAMWDEDPSRGRLFAEKYGMEFVPDIDSVLSRRDIDAVSVTAPTSMHPGIIIKSARAGKHIFTEKVLALTNAEAADIKKAVEKSGVKFCISFPHRIRPYNLFAKKVIDDKLLGQITLLRVREAHGGLSAGWLPPHFLDKDTCGGGSMIDLGAHPMYLIRWLMGRPEEITSVFTSVYGNEIEDNSVSVMNYKNGAIAVSETGFVSSVSPFSMQVYGTDGALIIENDSVWIKSGSLNGYIEKNQMPEALPSPINQFVTGILKNEKIHFGIDDAVALTEMMDAAYRSYREAKHIKF